MYVAPFEVAIFNGPPPLVSTYDREVFGLLLETLVAVNVVQRQTDPSIPLLHDAIADGRLKYVEPENVGAPWRCAVSSLVAGEVSCEDASAYRIAELRVRFGIDAVPIYKVGMHRDGVRRMIHVAIGLPNGEVEDVSRRAGMR